MPTWLLDTTVTRMWWSTCAIMIIAKSPSGFPRDLLIDCFLARTLANLTNPIGFRPGLSSVRFLSRSTGFVPVLAHGAARKSTFLEKEKNTNAPVHLHTCNSPGFAHGDVSHALLRESSYPRDIILEQSSR